jgi:hypothetical protein
VAAAPIFSTATLTTADVQHKQQSSYGGDRPEQGDLQEELQEGGGDDASVDVFDLLD